MGDAVVAEGLDAPAEAVADFGDVSVVAGALRAAVEPLSLGVRRVAGYHLGWDSPSPGGGGKLLRPALALCCAQAVGGTVAQGMPAAVAVQLVHEFTLLHDDIMDGDRVRRGRPAAWTVFGAGPALLAGDGLLALAVDTLAGCGSPWALAALRELAGALLAVMRGQDDDLAWEAAEAAELAACEAIAQDKTAALFATACAAGAILAGAPAGGSRVGALRAFGRSLGMAFQLGDDLLGIWGEEAVTGKPVGADLRRRKKTLPVAYALASGLPAAAELARRYRRPGPGADCEAAELAVLVEEAGGRGLARRQLAEHVHAALRELAGAELAAGPAGWLAAIARSLVDRDL
jgi:geranylgeranyl diphosphate synthase, type I